MSRLTLLIFFLLCTFSAQAEDEDVVHWAYASLFGSGWYQLDGNREVYVLRIPPKWYYSDSSINEDASERQVGIEFHFPLTLGWHKLEELDDFFDVENIGTVSFVPGVEVEFPVTPRWYLRGYGHAGWGTDTKGDSSAWIYNAGIKSRYGFNHGKLNWGVVNELFVAGYNPDSGDSDSVGGLLAGADFSYPLKQTFGTNVPLELNWDVTYRWFPSALEFETLNSESVQRVKDEWEIGIALARQDKPFKILFFNFEQLGLSYRFSSNGQFNAITFNLKAPFRR